MLKHLFKIIIMLLSLESYAQNPDVCSMGALLSLVQNNISIADQQIYLQKISDECLLKKKYLELSQQLKTNYDLELTDITQYQALRFTQRKWYDRALQSDINKPVEKIYQIKKEYYSKPLSEQSTDIWDNWAVGVQQLPQILAQIKQGESLNLDLLKNIHRGLFPFYPMITEKGDYAHEPEPGILKPTQNHVEENPWWKLSDEGEITNAKKVVESENQFYQSLNLLTAIPDYSPTYIQKVFDIRLVEDSSDSHQTTAVFSGHSMVHRQNTELILNMVDTLLKKSQKQDLMIWNNRLFTPGELAYFTQQYYVRVHPFHEGNGRTSRFLQELILNFYGLPHGSSGDLMDIDVLTPFNDYYKNAIQYSHELLNSVEKCLTEYQTVKADQQIRFLDQTQFSYPCRILADRSKIWDDLKQKNVAQPDYQLKIEELESRDKAYDQQHFKSLQSR